MDTVVRAGTYVGLRSEMSTYYDTMKDLSEDGANPVFLAVRGRIFGDMEAFCKKYPETPPVSLKADCIRQWPNILSRSFFPIPFLFEMGLRRSDQNGDQRYSFRN